jgi:hypothetical protein
MIEVRGGVVDVGRDEHHVGDAPLVDEPEQAGDLVLAPGRRRVEPLRDSFDERVVRHHQTERHAAGDDLPQRARRGQLSLQPGQLRAAQHRAGRAGRWLVSLAAGSAEAARVDQDDVEQRPARDAAVDAARTAHRASERHVVEQRAPRHGGQLSLAARRPVARVSVGGAGREPVVAHLVVVPLGGDRRGGREPAHRRVLQVVGEVAAEVGQRLRHARLRRGHPVAPHLPVGQAHLRRQRIVGVDEIAGADEQLRGHEGHGVEDAIAALVRIQALPPALTA